MPRSNGPVQSCIAEYNFATHGGTAGNITITAPTLPSGAVVYAFSYRVITTCQSATDAATIALGFATDGNIIAPLAISDAANVWDQGLVSPLSVTATSWNEVLLTANRAPVLVVASENLTAGRIKFEIFYWIS